MIYKIIRHDKESDDITEQSFNSYNEAYDLLEEIFTDVCCSDADYEDRPYYEIIKVEEWNLYSIISRQLLYVEVSLIWVIIYYLGLSFLKEFLLLWDVKD